MSATLVGVLALSGLFAMIFLRVPVGIALGIAGSLGYMALSGLDATLNLLGSIPFEIGYNYDLSIIALFVLMGNFAMVSGMSRDLYDMARSLVGHWPGGLASATVVGCAGFAAVAGSSRALPARSHAARDGARAGHDSNASAVAWANKMRSRKRYNKKDWHEMHAYRRR